MSEAVIVALIVSGAVLAAPVAFGFAVFCYAVARAVLSEYKQRRG